MDIQNFLRFSEESLDFIPDAAYSYLPEDSWISLSTSLEDLSTLELHHPENNPYWTRYIQEHSAQLREVTLSNIDQTEGSEEMKHNELNLTEIVGSLDKCKELRCLRFERKFLLIKNAISMKEC